MSRVSDLFKDVAAFERLLNDAESEARRGWDEDFVIEMKEKFEEYGAGMFLSERQLEQLERIANA